MPESTLYINGAWVASSDGAVREIRSPHDNSVVATVSEATAADTRDAITAFRRRNRLPRPPRCHRASAAAVAFDSIVIIVAVSIAVAIDTCGGNFAQYQITITAVV